MPKPKGEVTTKKDMEAVVAMAGIPDRNGTIFTEDALKDVANKNPGVRLEHGSRIHSHHEYPQRG